MIRNGWHLYRYRLFAQRLTELEQAVASLAARDPTGYKLHPQTKLLASVFKAINETVPANPADPVFRPHWLELEPANLDKLTEVLEDHDDVQNVWSNFDIDEKELEALAS